MSENKVGEHETFSALGTTPVCNMCGEEVKVGEHVMQTFMGLVKTFDDELVVVEEKYRLVHARCNPTVRHLTEVN